MFLHRLNRHFFPVKYTCGQGGLHIGLFKDLGEVFNLSGTGGGDHRDGDCQRIPGYKIQLESTRDNRFFPSVTLCCNLQKQH